LNCLIELHYLPSIHYISEISKHKTICIEKHEHYVKQTYRSRCHLKSSQGVETLIVPVTTPLNKTTITDVRVDYSQKWLNNHWRTIQSAYGKAPFYEFYADALNKILFKQHTFLYDLNLELLTMCLKWLKLDIRLQESLAYEKNVSAGTTDLRNVIRAKKHNSPNNSFQARAYTQVFGNTFANNLSTVDLVFCIGPQALTYVQQSV
jgi:hypothetical protein